MFWVELGAKVLGTAQNRCRCILGSQKLWQCVKLTATESLHHSVKLTPCCEAETALRGSYLQSLYCVVWFINRATRPSVWPGPFYALSTYKRDSLRIKMVSISLDVAVCKTSFHKKDWNVFCTRFHVTVLHVTYIRAICITYFNVIWSLFPVRFWFIVEPECTSEVLLQNNIIPLVSRSLWELFGAFTEPLGALRSFHGAFTELLWEWINGRRLLYKHYSLCLYLRMTSNEPAIPRLLNPEWQISTCCC